MQYLFPCELGRYRILATLEPANLRNSIWMTIATRSGVNGQ